MNIDLDDLVEEGICSKQMIPLYCTTDLSIFKDNELNREFRIHKVNEFVYKLNHGKYMTAPYITVLPDLTLADGHHRIKAIKEFLSQKNCPVKSIPVWFLVTENTEYLHNCNTGGSMWNAADHIKYYKESGKIHYIYLDKSLKEIKDKQKEMHIACKLGNSEIMQILRGLSPGTHASNVERDRGHFELGNGQMKILVKKEYILNILPYYKDIQSMPEYQGILKTTSARSSLLFLLIALDAFEGDMDYVVSTIMNIKKPSVVLSSHITANNGGIKEIIFDLLGIRFKRKIFKYIGELLNIDFKQVPNELLTFNKVMSLYYKLVHSGIFRPEGLYKQEEIMNLEQ